jgi:hippurate hydrolase
MKTSYLENDLINWRRDFHSHPELNFDVLETSKKITAMLKSSNIEVHNNIGKSGLVGVIKKGKSDRSIGIRADMDALPVNEINTFDYKSKFEGKMHACGHDGHVTMALGAAKHLAEKEDFDGTAYFIFQPDEEQTQGAQAMIDDGLFDRFSMDEIYAFHNLPGMEVGTFATRAGTITGSESLFRIELKGVGGHSALPHMGVDTITVGTQIITALQSIVSRKLNPAVNGVVSVTEFITDGTENVLPGHALILGDTRALSPESNMIMEDSMKNIVNGIAQAHGVEVKFEYRTRTNMTINTPEQARFASMVAEKLVGKNNVDGDCEPKLFSEDFSQMLMHKPGCYILIGNGIDGSCGKTLHSSDYDFNDQLLVTGSSFWSELVLEKLS